MRRVVEERAEIAAVADRLYEVPPRQFVAERDAAVAAAREAGDAVTAAAVAKLRRPTVAAWLVNLLALRRPELMTQLAELATALQAAQRELDGGQLRELTNQRRATVSALVTEARSVAREADPETTDGKLPLAELERTLHAALVDRDVAEAVRSGRLVKAAAADGFGELPRARLRLVSGGAGGPGGGELAPVEVGQPGGGDLAPAERAEATRRAVQAELDEARAAAEAATAELDRATAAQRAAKQALAEVDAALAELANQRSVATGRLAQADAAGLAARRAVVVARRRVGEAEAALSTLPEDT
jgi:hypothetical protein